VSDLNATAERAVLDLGQRWAAAERRGDVEALGATLADDFECVGPLGFVLDRQQYLAPRRSGDMTHEALAWEDVRVRVYGQAAVAVGTQTQRSTYQGQDASGRFRVTQIAVRDDAEAPWRIAGMHLSPIAAPPGS